MDTPKPMNLVPAVDRRRDFIETHKKELIGIGILSGILVLYGLYRMYRWLRGPKVVAGQTVPTVIIKQQQQPAPVVPAPQPTIQIRTQQAPAAAAPQVKAPQQTPQIKAPQQVKAPQQTPQIKAPQQAPAASPQVKAATPQQAPTAPQQVKVQKQIKAPSVSLFKKQQIKVQQRKSKGKQQQMKTPRLPNAQQINGNLPSTGNVVSTGFSNQFVVK